MELVVDIFMSCTHKRNNAIVVWYYKLKQNNTSESTYRLGVRTQNHIFLDFESKQVDILSYAYLLKNLIYVFTGKVVQVAIFESAKGYHLASGFISYHDWEQVYKHVLEYWKDEPNFCYLHALLSLKYDYTTLRISPKAGNIPKLLKVI
jgi:hypothetical protein